MSNTGVTRSDASLRRITLAAVWSMCLIMELERHGGGRQLQQIRSSILLSEAEPNSCSEVRNKGQAQNDWRENQQHFVASWIWGRRGDREISKMTNFYVR